MRTNIFMAANYYICGTCWIASSLLGFQMGPVARFCIGTMLLNAGLQYMFKEQKENDAGK